MSSVYQQLGDQAGYDSVHQSPISGEAIVPTKCGSFTFSTGASGETNTLPDPVKEDLQIDLTLLTDGGGDRVITASTKINQSGNTIMTFADASDTIRLKSIPYGSGYRWSVVGNDGVALS